MRAARAGATVPDWENPAVLGVNKRAAHAPLRSFRDADAAVAVFRPAVGGEAAVAAADPALAPLRVSTEVERQRAATSATLAARGVAGSASSGVRKLSGCDWAFKLFRNPQEVPEDFPQPSYAASDWTSVRRGLPCLIPPKRVPSGREKGEYYPRGTLEQGARKGNDP
jgi:beta-galactosidase